MNKAFLGIWLLAILLVSQSCSRHKTKSKQVTVDTVAVTPLTLPDTASKQPVSSETAPEKQVLMNQLAPLLDRHITYNTFTGKAKVHFQSNDEKREVSANLRIQKGKFIWINVVFGGLIQVARIYITPDSIKFLNFLQNEAVVMPFSDMKKLIPVDVSYQAFEDLIIGNILQQGKITDASDFTGGLSLQTLENNNIQSLVFNKTDTTLRSLQYKTNNGSGPQMNINYGNYSVTNGNRFAESRTFNILNGQSQVYIDMNFNNYSFNTPVDAPFSIPSKYTIKSQP